MPAFLRCIMPAFVAVLWLSPVANAQVTEQQLNVRLLEFSKQKDDARVRKMVDEGADVNSRNRRGETTIDFGDVVIKGAISGDGGDGERIVISSVEVEGSVQR